VDDKFDLLKKKFDSLYNRQTVHKAQDKLVKPGALPAEWEQVHPHVYVRSCREKNPLAGHAFAGSLLNPDDFTQEQICFFDVETTGLSGGAGNMIFLIGIGTLCGASLTIKQIFLADFPGEPDFISCLEPLLAPAQLFVSYNGRAFDSHIIASRFLLNGKEAAFPHQLDLLYHARRLWKSSIGSCSLGAIEERILDRARTDDIPGSEVPDVYFDYLRTGKTAQLLKVFEHNYQDIFSLAYLLQWLLLIYSGQVDDPLVDCRRLGEFLLEKNTAAGIALLEKGFGQGNVPAGTALSLYYKRQRVWEKAALLWEQLFRQHHDVWAGIELAKFCEHRLQDYPQALQLVESVWRLNLPLTADEKADLQKRETRLQERVKRLG